MENKDVRTTWQFDWGIENMLSPQTVLPLIKECNSTGISYIEITSTIAHNVAYGFNFRNPEDKIPELTKRIREHFCNMGFINHFCD